MKYRVAKEVNTLSKEERYFVERKGFFGWKYCTKRIGMARVWIKRYFKTKEQADKYIEDQISCSSWIRIY